MSREQLAARQERTKGAVDRVYGDHTKHPVHVTCTCPRDTYKNPPPLSFRLSPPWWVVHGQSARVNMRSARPRKRKTPGGERRESCGRRMDFESSSKAVDLSNLKVYTRPDQLAYTT